MNLSLMLEQIADEFAPMLRERGLTCAVSAPPGVMLNCDPDKLQRVFDNLLRNAMNYSYPDSEISVSLRVENGRAEIAFANHGDTIPAEQLERLFEQFYRLDSARTSRTGGFRPRTCHSQGDSRAPRRAYKRPKCGRAYSLQRLPAPRREKIVRIKSGNHMLLYSLRG